MEQLKSKVEQEIERVYANKEKKEIQSIVHRKIDKKVKKNDSAMSLNEDLFGLDTLEPTAD